MQLYNIFDVINKKTINCLYKKKDTYFYEMFICK